MAWPRKARSQSSACWSMGVPSPPPSLAQRSMRLVLEDRLRREIRPLFAGGDAQRRAHRRACRRRRHRARRFLRDRRSSDDRPHLARASGALQSSDRGASASAIFDCPASGGLALCRNRRRQEPAPKPPPARQLEHDPEKRKPVFRKDHAPPNIGTRHEPRSAFVNPKTTHFCVVSTKDPVRSHDSAAILLQKPFASGAWSSAAALSASRWASILFRLLGLDGLFRALNAVPPFVAGLGLSAAAGARLYGGRRALCRRARTLAQSAGAHCAEQYDARPCACTTAPARLVSVQRALTSKCTICGASNCAAACRCASCSFSAPCGYLLRRSRPLRRQLPQARPPKAATERK